jgi:hypothetical protein
MTRHLHIPRQHRYACALSVLLKSSAHAPYRTHLGVVWALHQPRPRVCQHVARTPAQDDSEAALRVQGLQTPCPQVNSHVESTRSSKALSPSYLIMI